MLTSQIPIGSDVELNVHYKGKTLSLKSKVQLIEEKIVFITPITKDGKCVGFPEECYIDFIYYEDSKVYKWSNSKIDLVRHKNQVLHRVSLLTEEGETLNRRDSYRVYVGDEVNIGVISAHGLELVQVLLKDISETGMSFVTDKDYELNRNIRLKINEDNFRYNLVSKIVRKEFKENLKAYVYGCTFTEGNKDINKYIMKKQREKKNMF